MVMRYVLIVLVLLLAAGLYHVFKPMPRGTSMRGRRYGVAEDDIRFLRDLTFETNEGVVVHDQQIFDEIFSLISQAREYILLDLFLFNSYTGDLESSHRQLCRELTDHLLERRRACPQIRIDFISDPINGAYGGAVQREWQELKDAGVNVIYTDLDKMRDSNLVYSPWWRVLIAWLGNTSKGGPLKHPFSDDEPRVTWRSYFKATNFKANHRKVLVMDSGDDYVSIVMSANPHDASSAHSNVALKVRGPLARDIWRSERAVARFSGAELSEPQLAARPDVEPHVVRLLTEQKIRRGLLKNIKRLDEGDQLMLAMFYVTDQGVLRALKRAVGRGVDVRMILDPSNDAFGRSKYGIPNQPMANELVRDTRGGIKVRWYKVHGEQFHTKMVMGRKVDGDSFLLLGSANLTRRNIRDYNLESDLLVRGPGESRLMQECFDYYERLWHNRDAIFTDDFSVNQDTSLLKRRAYKAWERSGWSTY